MPIDSSSLPVIGLSLNPNTSKVTAPKRTLSTISDIQIGCKLSF